MGTFPSTYSPWTYSARQFALGQFPPLFSHGVGHFPLSPPQSADLQYKAMHHVGWVHDRLRAGKLSRYVTSHSGQLSLAIPLWVGEMSTSLRWECNRRFGVALAMRHRQ